MMDEKQVLRKLVCVVCSFGYQ